MTLDVTGLPMDVIESLEAQIRYHRESHTVGPGAIDFATAKASLDRLAAMSVEERLASFEKYFESLEKTDAVIEDDSRRSMALYTSRRA